MVWGEFKTIPEQTASVYKQLQNTSSSNFYCVVENTGGRLFSLWAERLVMFYGPQSWVVRVTFCPCVLALLLFENKRLHDFISKLHFIEYCEVIISFIFCPMVTFPGLTGTSAYCFGFSRTANLSPNISIYIPINIIVLSYIFSLFILASNCAWLLKYPDNKISPLLLNYLTGERLPESECKILQQVVTWVWIKSLLSVY